VSVAACERNWWAIDPEGNESAVSFRIDVPQEQPTGEWGATVLVSLDGRTCMIFGIDSWQSLELAQKFAATRLADYRDRGWAFFWESGMKDPAEW
jgi:hypothetical protein